jgi:hypothetical protein
MHAWDQFCTDLRQLRQSGRLSKAQLDQLGEEAERLYNAGALSNDQVMRLTEALLDEKDLALIDGIAYGLAKLINTPLGELADEAGVPRASSSWMSPGEIEQTIAASAAKLAHTPIDQLAAEAAAKRASKALPHMPGHVGSGVVLQNPHDHPSRWNSVYEVRWLDGYPVPPLPPMIDGHFVHLVFVDALPVGYGQ